mmetsp:Transcript_20317/g.24310  ORF Transcript_20317/g.24310 Transcript_20317/m.24310 type:complete len:148 (-) Transcript_20317:296-739(-)|eukprot:CAMPEP_0197846162 /NCGR_PEP_ID=MMETSP1438-20131217/2959_1 /TAXON_ID=1461541 /ORGANISM="Pterosperma sp., Strain CCMP1384" /LENGTH=147 /DNA_ID=CAMNT_0043457711 /DNA_START=104 /DNA_END=547 /DNA_ORIENTATION=+
MSSKLAALVLIALFAFSSVAASAPESGNKDEIQGEDEVDRKYPVDYWWTEDGQKKLKKNKEEIPEDTWDPESMKNVGKWTKEETKAYMDHLKNKAQRVKAGYDVQTAKLKAKITEKNTRLAGWLAHGKPIADWFKKRMTGGSDSAEL